MIDGQDTTSGNTQARVDETSASVEAIQEFTLQTSNFAAEFGTALALADVVLLLDVYGAREDPLPGVTAALIAQAVPLPADCVFYEPCWVDVPGRLADLVRPGDVVVTMGAGDVTMLGPRLLAELARRGHSTSGSAKAGSAIGGAGPP